MCTGIPVIADKGLIFARTMEFGKLMNSHLVFYPKGTKFQAMLQEDKASQAVDGASWEGDLAFMGPDYENSGQLIEGFNQAGLHIAGFYFPDFAGYADFPKKKDRGNAVSSLDLANYILSNYRSVNKACNDLKKGVFKVVKSYSPFLGLDAPMHWIIQDATGKNVKVIEIMNGAVTIYDNPYGVFSNGPQFDWHLTNLRNYVNLTPFNLPNYVTTDYGNQIAPLGQGSGMLGLPGDFTPPSRFVRAAALSQTVTPVKDNAEGVSLCWNLISNVDIPIGAARPAKGSEEAHEDDFTQWVSVSSLKDLKFYFRTYTNQMIRYVDFWDLYWKPSRSSKKRRLNKKKVVIPMDQPANYQNVTPKHP